MLSWRFLQDEAGYGVLSDIMSHAIDMALFLCGPIRRVVSVKEIFVKERPLPQPGAGTHYERGKPISGVDETGPGTLVFQAGTRWEDEQLVTSGGRVLAVTGLGASVPEATARAYAGAGHIEFEGAVRRGDIAAGAA